MYPQLYVLSVISNRKYVSQC